MRITKYQHACIVLEDQGQKIMIDPGNRTPFFGDLEDVLAVVVTHVHGDHFYPEHLGRVTDHNPNVRIFTTQEVNQVFQNPRVTVVQSGDEHAAGPFTLHFTGGLHATVHPDWPSTVQNIGVRVNDAFYYGGDSLTLPDKPVKVLAAPVSYGWVKMDEALDFVAKVNPDICFPTHNEQLSKSGTAITNMWVTRMCEKHGIECKPLAPGDYLDI